MRICACGTRIPAERLEILPHTDTCVQCSTEEKVQGVPAYGHKTGGGVAIVHPRASEAMRLVRNQYRRTRFRG